LIEGIARAGRAEAFVVTSQREAIQQAQRFNRYISAPALTSIRLEAEGVELYDLEPAKLPDLLAQRPVMVIGKYRNASADASIRLQGVDGQGERQWSFRLQEARASDATLRQLWARKRLERLYVIPAASKDEQRDSILRLGLRYSLLTRHTSFVAVDETVRNTTADAQDVKQPLSLPQGVSNLAVGRPMPEPGLLWLAIVGALMLIGSRLWRRHRALEA
jgi:Ca-activated chloride channel family protein